MGDKLYFGFDPVISFKDHTVADFGIEEVELTKEDFDKLVEEWEGMKEDIILEEDMILGNDSLLFDDYPVSISGSMQLDCDADEFFRRIYEQAGVPKEFLGIPEEFLEKQKGEDNMTEREEIGIKEANELLSIKENKLDWINGIIKNIDRNGIDTSINIGGDHLHPFVNNNGVLEDSDIRELLSILKMKLENKKQELEQNIQCIKNGISLDDEVMRQIAENNE